MKENIIAEKTLNFAARIMNLYKHRLKKKETIIAKQIFRSAASIGAMEAQPPLICALFSLHMGRISL